MKAVLKHMDDYQANKQVTDMSGLHQSTHTAAVYQATIGPRSFGEGLLSAHWRIAQQRYYVNTASKEKSKRWVSNLIQNCGKYRGVCGNSATTTSILMPRQGGNCTCKAFSKTSNWLKRRHPFAPC